MKKLKVYLSGRITGVRRETYLRQFAEAEKMLKEVGFQVVNPTKFLICKWPWLYRLIGYRLTLSYDIWRLSRCDAFCMLPGWQLSRGARIERKNAINKGLNVVKLKAPKK